LVITAKDPAGKAEFKRKLTAEELVARFPSVLDATKTKNVSELAKRMAEGFGRKGGLGDDTAPETLWGVHERLDSATGYRAAREQSDAIFAQFSDPDFVERERQKNPEVFVHLASTLPWDRFKDVLGNQKVPRDLKLRMWQKRAGDYARRIAEAERKVKAGQILEKGDEYNFLILKPYMHAAKNISHDEFEEMISVEAVVTDANGNPYRKRDVLSDKVLVPGEADKPLTFEDLRKTVALWQGSLSGAFVDIKKKKLFGYTERRNLGQRKRKPLTEMRDKWTAIQIVFGNEKDTDVLPVVAGTVDYNAPNASKKWIEEEINSMELIIGTPKKPSMATAKEKAIAEKRLRFAKLLQKGVNALGEDWLKMSQEDRDAAIYKAKQKLKTPLEDPSPSLEKLRDARANLITTDPPNLYYLVNELIQLEGGYPEQANDPSGIPDWYRGKSDDEAANIMGKRERWAPPMIYGLSTAKFVALLEGQDESEQRALWEQVLIRGSRALIDNVVSNENIMNIVGWPDTERLEKINYERHRLYPEEEPLEENPFRERGKKEDNVENAGVGNI
jgi:hypothetical protein